ncbi:MAG: SIS domain-containing protein [Thermotogae bacterium]|nr:SIS domain-containing protein [Thermotogota bacterium]
MEELRALLADIAELEDGVHEAAEVIVRAIASGGKVLVCGNGGSATDAQHFVAELVGRMGEEREPLPALALTSDTAVLTALANDYGYAEVFARQVGALGRSGDVLVAISTSGRSRNVNRAVDEALGLGLKVIYLVGGDFEVAGHIVLRVPSANAQRVQEVHRFLLHVLAEEVEEMLRKRP